MVLKVAECSLSRPPDALSHLHSQPPLVGENLAFVLIREGLGRGMF